MKVLFVSSGKSGDVSKVIKNQGESLIKAGIEVDYFVIKPGLGGYISSIQKIRKAYRKGNFCLVHAHYSLSAFAASLAGRFPLVVSLMGSDVYMSLFPRIIARIFSRTRWNATIVKNQSMKELLNINNAYVIPNGVDLEMFRPISPASARKYLKYPHDKKLILFFSLPNRPEKNFQLATKAVKAMKDNNIELKRIYNIPNSDIPYYLSASDLLLLTSFWEGSPNVIKEAMACNCPIVATDVGDVRWVLGETEGCYIVSFDPEDIAEKIKTAISFGKRTNGREFLIKLGLDSESIARKIIDIYIKLH